MAEKQRQKRGKWKDSSDRKVSAVEAASVVESYLIEQNFQKTLAEFRAEAAYIWPKLKTGDNGPSAKSLNRILQDYVVLREEHKSLEAENSKLEQDLKSEKQTLIHSRNRMQTFVQQIRSSLSAYETGSTCVPQTPPSQQPFDTLQGGHMTPPGLSDTPSFIGNTLLVEPSKKRTIHPIPSINPTPKPPATKKARQNILPAAPPRDAQESPPWPLCGGVRKTSLNTVRPVQSKSSKNPVHLPAHHASKSLFCNPPPLQDPLQPRLISSLTLAPLVSSKRFPSDAPVRPLVPETAKLPQPLKPAPHPPAVLASPPPSGSLKSTHPDPKTPHSTSPSSLQHFGGQPDGYLTFDEPSQSRKGDAFDSSTGRGPAHQGVDQHSSVDSEDPEHDTSSLPKRQEKGHNVKRKTSPDSHPCVGTRGMKPSKTMRPLTFSKKQERIPEERPSSAPGNERSSPVSPDSSSSLAAQASETNASGDHSPASSNLEEEVHDALSVWDEPLCEYLAPIDDILGCLNDSCFSDLVGDVLTEGAGIGVPSLNPGSELNGSRGEDSCGFLDVMNRITCQQSSQPIANSVLSNVDLNGMGDGSLKDKLLPCSKATPPRPATEGETARTIADKENAVSS